MKIIIEVPEDKMPDGFARHFEIAQRLVEGKSVDLAAHPRRERITVPGTWVSVRETRDGFAYVIEFPQNILLPSGEDIDRIVSSPTAELLGAVWLQPVYPQWVTVET